MTIAIIREEKQLNKLISQTITAGKKYASMLHQASMSAVVHLLEHGQAGPINRLYESMNSNNSASFKQWLRRLNLYVGLGEELDKLAIKEINSLTPEIRNGYIREGLVIGYEEKSFIVTSVKSDPKAKEKRLAAVKLVEERFLEPRTSWPTEAEAEKEKGKYTPWYERNNFAEVRFLGDAQALEQLKRVANNLGLGSKQPNADRVKVSVSDRMRTIIKTALDNAESLVEHEEVSASSDRSESIVDAAMVARENKAKKAKKAKGSDNSAHTVQ